MATITDYFNKASNMNGSYPAVATVTVARSTGATTLTCDDLSSWAADTPVHFSTFKVSPYGSVDPFSQTDWKGIVSDNTITNLTRLAGAIDSGNIAGDRVELNPTIGWVNDLVTGILKAHTQDGSLRDNIVTTNKLASNAVTSAKIASGAVTSAKLSSGCVTADKLASGVISSSTGIDYTYTGEVNTGGKYVDGKAIYRKVINIGNLPNNSTKYVNHGISNLYQVVKMEAVASKPGDTSFPIPYSRETVTGTGITMWVTHTQIVIETPYNRSEFKTAVVLHYTKGTVVAEPWEEPDFM